MHDVEEFKITLLPGADRLKVLIAVRGVCEGNFSLKDISMIAGGLVHGDRWSPTPEMLRADPRTSGLAKIATIEVELRPDPYAELKRQREEESALLEAGANGDAEAAIRFCKGLLTGTITYGQAFA